MQITTQIKLHAMTVLVAPSTAIPFILGEAYARVPSEAQKAMIGIVFTQRMRRGSCRIERQSLDGADFNCTPRSDFEYVTIAVMAIR